MIDLWKERLDDGKLEYHFLSLPGFYAKVHKGTGIYENQYRYSIYKFNGEVIGPKFTSGDVFNCCEADIVRECMILSNADSLMEKELFANAISMLTDAYDRLRNLQQI